MSIFSAITFGAYTFPASFGITQRTQDSQIDEVKIPYADGSNAPAGTRTSKVVQIRGTVGGSGAVDLNGTYITNRDQAETELNLMASYLESGYQQLKIGATPARYLFAQKRKFGTTYIDGSGQAAIEVEIEFVAQDPRWVSTHVSGQGGNGTCASGGSSIVYPTFTLTAASSVANPALTVTPAGAPGSIVLQLAYTLLSTDTIVIDTDPRNRANALLLNGTARLDLINAIATTNNAGNASFFPYFLPGNNVIAITAGVTMVANWQDAYLY